MCGASQVTKESGKHRGVHFRWACNKRFHQAVTTFADHGLYESPWATRVYAQARSRENPYSIRVPACGWIRVIWRCWIDQIPYDSGRYGNASRLDEPGSESLAT